MSKQERMVFLAVVDMALLTVQVVFLVKTLVLVALSVTDDTQPGPCKHSAALRIGIEVIS